MTGAEIDLRRRVVNFLVSRNVPSLRSVKVFVDGSEVTLRGQVPSYYCRQLYIACTQRVAGVIKLLDELEVISENGDREMEVARKRMGRWERRRPVRAK